MKIIDGNNMMHREADKVGRGMHPVRFVYGRFLSPPETTVIVWDGPYANKRRKDIYPGYKANRRPKEESKYHFFDLAKGVLRFAPIIQIECPSWEADDVIGTLINRWYTKHKLTIETNDGDYWQHSDKAYLPLVTKKWHHLSPEDCVLYKSLVGDAKDGIPGLSGFGSKSWDYLSDKNKAEIRKHISNNNALGLVQMDCWPPRVDKKLLAFDAVILYHKLNTYWDVPEEEINEVTTIGKLNLAAAEIFLEKFLL